MVARGQAVSHAVMSSRRAMTKPRRKTPSIGPDIEGCEVHEVQIPGKKIEPQRPFLDTLALINTSKHSYFGGIGQNRKRGGLGCTSKGGCTVRVVAIHN